MTNTPSRRDRTRPLELLGLSAVFGVFVAVIVLIGTRDLVYTVIALGVTFIVSLVVLATLALTVSPPSKDELRDLDEQDRGH